MCWSTRQGAHVILIFAISHVGNKYTLATHLLAKTYQSTVRIVTCVTRSGIKHAWMQAQYNDRANSFDRTNMHDCLKYGGSYRQARCRCCDTMKPLPAVDDRKPTMTATCKTHIASATLVERLHVSFASRCEVKSDSEVVFEYISFIIIVPSKILSGGAGATSINFLASVDKSTDTEFSLSSTWHYQFYSASYRWRQQ